MSAQAAKASFAFQLPTLSYIDAKWEEPNLRTPDVARSAVRQGGLAAWLSRQVAAFVASNRTHKAARELSFLSDRELMDIGLHRADLSRVFSPALDEDLRQRGA